jgi:hypothetical protein
VPRQPENGPGSLDCAVTLARLGRLANRGAGDMLNLFNLFNLFILINLIILINLFTCSILQHKNYHVLKTFISTKPNQTKPNNQQFK